MIDSPNGTIAAVQIAGLVARRIVCWAEPGANIGIGERFGLIRFGSRVDVFLPAGARRASPSARRRSAAKPCSPNSAACAGTPLVRVS